MALLLVLTLLAGSVRRTVDELLAYECAGSWMYQIHMDSSWSIPGLQLCAGDLLQVEVRCFSGQVRVTLLTAGGAGQPVIDGWARIQAMGRYELRFEGAGSFSVLINRYAQTNRS